MAEIIPINTSSDDSRRIVGFAIEQKYRIAYHMLFLMPHLVLHEIFCVMPHRGVRFMGYGNTAPLSSDELTILAFQLLNTLGIEYEKRDSFPSFKDITTDIFAALQGANITVVLPRNFRYVVG